MRQSLVAASLKPEAASTTKAVSRTDVYLATDYKLGLAMCSQAAMSEEGKMGKRGRKPKPWGPEVLRDIERMKGFPHMHGPFGLSLMARVAGSVGKDLCRTYNAQRLLLPDTLAAKIEPGVKPWRNWLLNFGYLFEGLTLFTESYGLPERERTNSHLIWMDPQRDQNGNPIPGTAHSSGEFRGLWGQQIPRLVATALLPPKDGRPFKLSPFGTTPINDATDERGIPESEFASYMKLVTVENNDVDGTLQRMVQDVGVRSHSREGMYLAGNGPVRDTRNRRVPPLVYVGRNEVWESRGIIRIATITTATVVNWLTGLGLDHKRADAIWTYIVDGLLLCRLFTVFDDQRGKAGAFGRKFRADFGEQAGEEIAGEATVGISLLARWARNVSRAELSGGVFEAALAELQSGPFKELRVLFRGRRGAEVLSRAVELRVYSDFTMLCLFGVYLRARFHAHGIYHPYGGTIRLCRRIGCRNPAFVWAPKRKDAGHHTGLFKADPPNYCKACESMKNADRQMRYRQNSKRRQRHAK